MNRVNVLEEIFPREPRGTNYAGRCVCADCAGQVEFISKVIAVRFFDMFIEKSGIFNMLGEVPCGVFFPTRNDDGER